MRYPSRSRSQSLVLPLRSWLVMGTTCGLLIAALSLAILNSRQHAVPAEMKHAIGDAVTPVVEGMSEPASVLGRIGDRVRQLVHLDEEVRRLREENSALLHWQTAARKLGEENNALRNLLKIRPMPNTTFVTAEVVTGNPSAFGRSLLLSAGARQGIARDQAVVTDEGLVGRIIETGESSSQVLLISDINSRIPVEIAETGEKAILIGTNGTRPTLRFADQTATALEGQRVVTAADGGVFPAGYAVGVVRKPVAGSAVVKPYVNASRLGFVRAVVIE